MLYQHKTTGGLVEKISQHGEGIFMVVNANDEVDYVHEDDLIPHLEATNEKIKTEERLTAELKSTGDKDAKPTNREFFMIPIPSLTSGYQKISILPSPCRLGLLVC